MAAWRVIIGSVFVLVPWLAVLAPMMHYVSKGWDAKRKDIMDGLSPSARIKYFKMFTGDGETLTRAAANANFERLYTKWYGRGAFLFSALIFASCAFIAISAVVLSVLNERGFLSNPVFDVPATAVAALSGAYMWVFNDLVSRARRLDFSPSDLQWATLRIITAIPMGYAFSVVVTPALAPFIAFSIGGFPLAEVVSILRRIASKNLGISTAAEDSADSIIKLQGINRTIVERLNNEDISTISQVAYCDPIRLTMRSNLTFNFVTDLMNQALVWVYFEGKLDTMRAMGARGAIEVRHLIDDLDGSGDGDDRGSKGRAREVVDKIAIAIQQDTASVENAFREIAHDPFTEFLSAVWEEVSPGQE